MFKNKKEKKNFSYNVQHQLFGVIGSTIVYLGLSIIDQLYNTDYQLSTIWVYINN